MRASGIAFGLDRLWLRRAGLRCALAVCHVLTHAAHVLHLLLHLAVALALALMALTMVHPAVPLAVRSGGLRVLGQAAGAVFVTLGLSQRPSAGEHRGRRDAADQKYFRVHDCLQRNREVRCLHALEGTDFTEVFQEQRFL
jgi:hypothetical protein